MLLPLKSPMRLPRSLLSHARLASSALWPSLQNRAEAGSACRPLAQVMQFYDPLRSFPLWGFGGQVRACSHQSALNGFDFSF